MKVYKFILVLFLSVFAAKVAGQCTLTSGAGSDDQTVCLGSSVSTITYTMTGAVSGSATGLPSGVSSSFTAPTLTISGLPTVSGTFNFQVTLNDAASGTCTSDGRIIVNDPLPVSVSISAGANPVCAGASVTFTAIPVNGGGSPAYQWYVNSSPAGPNSPSYTYMPDDDDVISVRLTSSEVCTSGSPAVSNEITMNVNPILPVSVSISAGANPVCAGASVTFTAIPVNGGGSPAYQWYVNSSPAGPNSPAYTYVPDDDDVISVRLTSSGVCTSGSPAVSNEITMTVNPILPVSVSIIESANNICNGTEVTFTAFPVNGGAIPVFQWYEGATPVGPNNATYSYDPGNGDILTVRLTSGETCNSGPATSNAISMTVYSSPPNTPGTISGSGTVCQGQTGVDYSISDVSNALYYEWVAGAGGTITSGQGTTAITVDYNTASVTPVIVSVRAQNTCGWSSFKNKSITVRKTPTAEIGVNGIIEKSVTICQNESTGPEITFYNPMASAIVITYNINGADQTTIYVGSGNSEHIHAPTSVTGNFTYSIVSVRYNSGTACSNVITGAATVTVTPTVGLPTPITVSAGSDPSCQLTNGTTTTTYTTTATNSTGFNWSLSTGSAGSINPTSGVMTWTNGFSGSVNIRVTANGCNGPSSQVIRTVNVTPTVGTPAAITVSGIQPACQLPDGSSTTTYTTTATNSTGFNWSLSNSTAGSINPTSGVMNWAAGFSGSVDIQVTANGCNGPSTQVKRTVNITPNVGTPSAITVSSGSEPICQLTNGITTTTYATTATNNTGFNWSLSNASAGSINSANGQMTWADGFSGNVNIQVTATGCNGISPQVIRSVSITPAVGTPTPIAIFAGSDPACQPTSGTTMTIYTTTATNSTGFNWSLSNGAAGTINPTNGLMTWTNGFSGNVDIRVTANGCGTSPQVTRPVTVFPLPVVTITGPVTPRITSSGNLYETQSGMSGYTWAISGGGTGSMSGNTYTVTWNTTGNQTISVNYIDTHGCTALNPEILNVAVKNLPFASDASISGYPALDNPLTGSYTYNDGSSGADNSTFRWLRNGIDPIAGATNSTYTPVIEDVNKTLTFEVTPISSVGPPTTGITVKSAPTELVEDLTGIPVADEVCIEGIRAVGNTISGEYRYTFSKAEGISTYRWLRRDIISGTDVAIGTGRQYTLVADDTDDTAEIIFEVTPVSSNLTPIHGIPVQSNPIARILIPKTEFSVSESDVIISSNEPGGVFSGTGVTGNMFSPGSAGATGSPYTLTYLLNIVNSSSSCSQQASKIVRVNPNVTSFIGFNTLYCHDSGKDTITISGLPSDAKELTFKISRKKGIVDTTGNRVIIDPGLMHPGLNIDTLYFSYKKDGLFFRISQVFKIDSVGTEFRIINLNPAYCIGDPREYIAVENVYPSGGTAVWTGDILTDTKAASAFADPSLGIKGTSYPVSYQYRSPAGCLSRMLTDSVTINGLPNSQFMLNQTYNIAGGEVLLVPEQPGGIFSGRGVFSGNTLKPKEAGLGEVEIKYSITDINLCSSSLGKKTMIRQAQGIISGIPSVICYSDTTFSAEIVGLPDSGIVVTSFTNTKNTLVHNPGGINADYNVPLADEGNDTLVFSYRWDGVDYSISKPILIDKLEQVYLKNLNPGDTICNNRQPYELYPSILGGVFKGRPVSGSNLYPLMANRSDTVTYIYTNSETGCTTDTIVPINVFPAPKISFIPADVCIESGSDSIKFINTTSSPDNVVSWLWEFTDQTGSYPGSDSIGSYLFSSGGLKKVSLVATTFTGCFAEKDTTIDIGVRPVPDFYWLNDCNHPGESLVLVDSTISPSPVTSRTWKIFDGAEFGDSTVAYYPKTVIGYLKVQYIVRTKYPNCFADIMKDIFIRPVIPIPADGYREGFEEGNGGWIRGETAGNSWLFGTPDRDKINRAYSGEFAWYTGFDNGLLNRENSSVVSPCFDFTSIERPQINIKLWKRFEKERDGATLQYRINDRDKWQNVGTVDEGIGWFNSAVIRGEPGGNQLGWTTMGSPDTAWTNAIHSLDELKGLSDVKLRIAYGSDGAFSRQDGVAFDDIWIGERSRNVLLEHFTNINDPQSRDANSLVNKIVRSREDDIINIQYHTNFPADDGYYNSNPGDASARILFYGLTAAPYTFVDGGTRKDFANIFDNNLANIDSNDVFNRSLIPARFSISLKIDTSNTGVLSVIPTIIALEDINSENVTLFIAMTEKENSDHTGLPGETVYYNIFRKFIPDAGGINLKKEWNKGDSLTIPPQLWQIGNISNSSDIEVIAFIQNIVTKELYQAESSIIRNISTGIEDLFGGDSHDFTLYPNPAVNKLTVIFKEPLTRVTDIRIYNLQGVVISSYKAGAGVTEFLISDPGLKAGIYLIRVTTGGFDYGFRKLIVTGD